MDSAADVALVVGKVYVAPGQEPIRDAAVLIGGTKILEVGSTARVRIPRGIKRIDFADRVITAGFWNSHVHFFERRWADAATMPVQDLARQLEDFTGYGFTSVFDLSSRWGNTRSLRKRIESGEVRGPRIRSTGEGLVPPDTVPPDDVCRVMGLMETPLPEVRDAAQATEFARRLLDEGVDVTGTQKLCHFSRQDGVVLE